MDICVCSHHKEDHFDASYNDDPNVAADDYEGNTEFCFECDCQEFSVTNLAKRERVMLARQDLFSDNVDDEPRYAEFYVETLDLLDTQSVVECMLYMKSLKEK